jgi:hypothetical protein
MVPIKLTVPELMNTADWAGLTKQRKIFLAEFLSAGLAQGRYNAVAAAQIAYPRIKHIKVWASRLMANARIKKVLALHFGFSETEMLLDDVRGLIKKSRRKGANLDILVAPWLRVAKALEALVAKEKSNG